VNNNKTRSLPKSPIENSSWRFLSDVFWYTPTSGVAILLTKEEWATEYNDETIQSFIDELQSRRNSIIADIDKKIEMLNSFLTDS